MVDKKIMIAAIAVVAVVVVAGCAVMLTGGKGGSSGGDDTGDALGLVYGNANGDNKIDSADLEIIEKITNGDLKFSDYPLADANRDGKVDNNDYGKVLDFIDGKSMTVYVKDSSQTVKSVKYPINGIFATGGTNSRVVYQVLDLEDKMVANATNDYISPLLDKTLYDKRANGDIKVVTTGATTADFTELSKLTFSLAIVEYSGMNTGYLDDKGSQWFSDFGVDVLAISADNFEELEKAVTTIGILVGSETQAKQLTDMLDNTLSTIKTKLGSKYGTATVMDIVMSNSVSGTDADYYHLTELAGGKNLADWSDSTRAFDPAKDPWLYDSKYNPDYLVHYRSMTYGDTVDKSTLSGFVPYFQKTAAYMAGDYYLINGAAPLPVRLAYTASVMYQDDLDANWYMEIFQDYVDTFCENSWNVSDYKIAWNTEEINAILG